MTNLVPDPGVVIGLIRNLSAHSPDYIWLFLTGIYNFTDILLQISKSKTSDPFLFSFPSLAWHLQGRENILKKKSRKNGFCPSSTPSVAALLSPHPLPHQPAFAFSTALRHRLSSRKRIRGCQLRIREGYFLSSSRESSPCERLKF